ncbi:hypothetical protein GCM10023340_39130 [Nocardioides marinquilinus]|uniref:Uncharacterized protein n=1 Tax=Nocardioides marinquilinus TaxID=1210400 RepID=A0ABP9PZZ1_9ACTN
MLAVVSAAAGGREDANEYEDSEGGAHARQCALSRTSLSGGRVDASTELPQRADPSHTQRRRITLNGTHPRLT